jgi:hypothetical protein
VRKYFGISSDYSTIDGSGYHRGGSDSSSGGSSSSTSSSGSANTTTSSSSNDYGSGNYFPSTYTASAAGRDFSYEGENGAEVTSEITSFWDTPGFNGTGYDDVLMVESVVTGKAYTNGVYSGVKGYQNISYWHDGVETKVSRYSTSWKENYEIDPGDTSIEYEAEYPAPSGTYKMSYDKSYEKYPLRVDNMEDGAAVHKGGVNSCRSEGCVIVPGDNIGISIYNNLIGTSKTGGSATLIHRVTDRRTRF